MQQPAADVPSIVGQYADNYPSKLILFYLAGDGVEQLYKFENFLVENGVLNEKQLLEKIEEFKCHGLIRVYGVYDGAQLRSSSVIFMTDLGFDVTHVLETKEKKEGYPTVKKLVSTLIKERLHHLNPKLKVTEEDILALYARAKA